MPTPNKGESKKDYLGRCMAYPEMNSKHPDSSQRYAICNSMWEQHLKSKASEWLNGLERVNPTNFTGHGRLLCDCGKVLQQCRCPHSSIADRVSNQPCSCEKYDKKN